MNFLIVCELSIQNGRKSVLILFFSPPFHFLYIWKYMFDDTPLCLDICMIHLVFLLFYFFKDTK